MRDDKTPPPLVSVVIPFFHTYARHLTECLESIRQQTWSSWELIIVDDASPTDDAERIVAPLGDPRMRVVRHERNRGQAAGRNTGIRHSHGPFILPVDCDDVLDPTHMEKLVTALVEHPEYGAAYSDHRLFGEIEGILFYPQHDTQWLLKEQWIPHPGTIVRRVLWERSGGYCEDPAFRAGNEDWDYFLSLAEVGMTAVRIPEPLYNYRQHRESITTREFACADFRMRKLMYQRHRSLFDLFNMRRPFLAGGYLTSGKALWRKGERMKGAAFLLYSAWLAPTDLLAAVWRRLRGTSGSRLVPVAQG